MFFLVVAGVFLIFGIIDAILMSRGNGVGTIFLAILLVIVGLCIPISGYEEPIIEEEIMLMPIIENNNIYVIETEDGTKICKYEQEGKYDESLKSNIIDRFSMVAEIEYVDENSQPILRKYVKKPKETIWNGIFAADESYYVFFVPENCIAK